MVCQADDKEPFFIVGIHVLPFHDRKHKVGFEVAHRQSDPFWHSPWRRDAAIPALAGIKRGSLAETTALRHLAEYTVQRFSADSVKRGEIAVEHDLLAPNPAWQLLIREM
jgi:hypothetical protein